MTHPYRADLPIRGLSVRQPRAYFIVIGTKRVETRSRLIGLHAGDWVAIHAGLQAENRAVTADLWRRAMHGMAAPKFTRGAIIGVARCVEVARVAGAGRRWWVEHVEGRAELSRDFRQYRDTDILSDNPTREERLGDWRPGRILYRLDDARALVRPIPWKGRLGLFPIPEVTRREIAAGLSWDVPVVYERVT